MLRKVKGEFGEIGGQPPNSNRIDCMWTDWPTNSEAVPRSPSPQVLKVEAEPESDLAWSADRSGVGLNHEFLIEDILHVKEDIRGLVHLPGYGEINRRKAAEPPGAIVRIVIVLGAGVVIRRTDVHEPLVAVCQTRGSAVPGHLCEKLPDKGGIGVKFRDARYVINVGGIDFPEREHPVFGVALNTPDVRLAHILTLLRHVSPYR